MPVYDLKAEKIQLTILC